MIKPLFTLAISTYNNGRFTKPAIDALKAQTCSDFECIIVDDGSEDDTCEIVEEEIKGDHRFRLIKCEHFGPQAAKNTGLDAAKGEYIIFPDADDTLTADCLENCKNHLDGQDVLVFGINNQFYEDDKLVKEEPLILQELSFQNGSEVADWYIKHKKLLLYSAANKMYRREMLNKNNIRFQKGLQWGEDRKFNYDVLGVCGRFDTLKEVHYNYKRVNEGSLTNRFMKHHIDTVLYLHKLKMDSILKLAKTTTETQKVSFRNYDLRNEVYNAFVHIAEHYDSLDEATAQDEINYLSHADIPDYFYGPTEHPKDNLIGWINQVVYKKEEERDLTQFDKVIVLGSMNCDHRINTAWKLFGQNPDMKFVCCGGNDTIYTDGKGGFYKEHEYMRKVLLDHGVKEENILLETESKNTFENLQYAFKYYCHDYELPALVTADFHVKRVEMMLEQNRESAEVFPSYGAHTRPTNWYKNLIGTEAIYKELLYLI